MPGHSAPKWLWFPWSTYRTLRSHEPVHRSPAPRLRSCLGTGSRRTLRSRDVAPRRLPVPVGRLLRVRGGVPGGVVDGPRPAAPGRAARRHLAGRRAARPGQLPGRRPGRRHRAPAGHRGDRRRSSTHRPRATRRCGTWILADRGRHARATTCSSPTGRSRPSTCSPGPWSTPATPSSSPTPPTSARCRSSRLARADLLGVAADDDGLDVDVLADRLAAGLRPRARLHRHHLPQPDRRHADRSTRRRALGRRWPTATASSSSRTTPTASSAGRGRPAPPLAACTDRVVTLGSFSKVLSPGLRVGYAVGPAALIADLDHRQAGRRPADRRPSTRPWSAPSWPGRGGSTPTSSGCARPTAARSEALADRARTPTSATSS